MAALEPWQAARKLWQMFLALRQEDAVLIAPGQPQSPRATLGVSLGLPLHPTPAWSWWAAAALVAQGARQVSGAMAEEMGTHQQHLEMLKHQERLQRHQGFICLCLSCSWMWVL